jgi:O-acetylserine/cysteine efflux transporter
MQLTPQDCVRGLVVATIWGTGVVLAKWALTDLPPILLMCFRFTLSALALIWFVPFPAGSFRKLLVISVLGGAVQYSLTFSGLKGLDASVTALLLQLEVPLLVLVGAVLLKERPSLKRLIGIALAFGGMVIITGEPKVSGAYLSVAMVIGGALSWATCQAFVRSLNLEGRTVTAWFALLTAPQLFIASLLFETGQAEAVTGAGAKAWAVVVYLGLVMTVVGDTTWNALVRRYPISTLAPFLLLQPVISALAAVALLGESLTAHVLAGGAVIIWGVAYIIWERPGGSQPG